MHDLYDSAHDEECPEDPRPRFVLPDKASYDSTDWSTSNRGENDEGNCVLEAGIFRLVEICNHTKSYRATSRGETAQASSDQETAKVRCQGRRELPDVDQEQGKLFYRKIR